MSSMDSLVRIWNASVSSLWDYLLLHQHLGRVCRFHLCLRTFLSELPSWAAIKHSLTFLGIVWELAVS